jgi:hypothetical protein
VNLSRVFFGLKVYSILARLEHLQLRIDMIHYRLCLGLDNTVLVSHDIQECL